jgi:hypothetical protein
MDWATPQQIATTKNKLIPTDWAGSSCIHMKREGLDWA